VPPPPGFKRNVVNGAGEPIEHDREVLVVLPVVLAAGELARSNATAPNFRGPDRRCASYGQSSHATASGLPRTDCTHVLELGNDDVSDALGSFYEQSGAVVQAEYDASFPRGTLNLKIIEPLLPTLGHAGQASKIYRNLVVVIEEGVPRLDTFPVASSLGHTKSWVRIS
jgi:hypothetical protein